MKPILFTLPGNEKTGAQIATALDAEKGGLVIRHFPDGETYVRVQTPVRGEKTILVCTLDHPDQKLLPLFFLARTLKSQGAASVYLVAPYLAYMRQDKIFKEGEGVTSQYFASLVSGFVDALITVDPHLHRRTSLREIYTIPCTIVHAADPIAQWIASNLQKPVLIGPDSESEQWVSAIADACKAPYIVLEKKRNGDNEVEILLPPIEHFSDHTPVMVDDIISTAGTMITTIGHLKKAGMKPPVCIGVHAIFSEDAYSELKKAGAEKIVTCNTIPHVSNEIDITGLLIRALSD